jgi:hypothetical protein
LSGTMQLFSHADPSKVTVLQIHGITESGGDAPPLLRIAVNNGNVYAFIKTDSTGDTTKSVLLLAGIDSSWFSCTVRMQNSHILISINDTQKLDENVSYWKYPNYLKAGCYPQSHSGTVTLKFSQLFASVTTTGITTQRQQTKWHSLNVFPNPCNPSTRIQFILTKQQDAHIRIVNLLGQTIADIVQTQLPAGTYSYTWNTATCASGIYFCLLKTDNDIECQKIIVMK